MADHQLAGSPETIRVVIVDDHALLREGTRRILERDGGFRVVAEAADGEGALEAVVAHSPDVVLLDVRMPGMNGVEVARRIAEMDGSVRVLMLSAFDEIAYVDAALSAGAAGYLLKTAPGAELCGAIRAVHVGVAVLDPDVSAGLLGRAGAARAGGASGEAGAAGSGFETLTQREHQVACLVAEGMSNKSIARRLGISPRTVEGHLNHVFDKLGTTSRSALVRRVLTSLPSGDP